MNSTALLLSALVLSALALVPQAQGGGLPTVFVGPSFHSAVHAHKEVQFSVRVSNMPQFNAFDIFVRVDPTVLNPESITCATSTDPTCKGMIFTVPFPDVNCVNGGAGITLDSPGNIGCTAQDGPGIAHSEIFCYGCEVSGSGLLFNVTFTSVAKGVQSVVDVYNDQIVSAGAFLPHVTTGAFYGSATAVPDFAVSASPFSQVIPQGRTGSVTVTLASLNGFAGTVTLNAKTVPGPPGVTSFVSLSSYSVSLTSGGTAMVTVTVSPTPSTPGGAYDLIVNGTATTTIGLIHSTSVGITVTVPYFTVASSLHFLMVAQGSFNSTTLTLTSINTFAGVVSLSTSVFPSSVSGVSITLSNSTFTGNSVEVALSPDGTAAATLTVFARSSTLPGLGFTVGVRAASGRLVFSTSVFVTVVPAAGKHHGHHMSSFALDGPFSLVVTPEYNLELGVLNHLLADLTLVSGFQSHGWQADGSHYANSLNTA